MKTEGIGFVRVCIWSHAQMWVDFPAASSTNHYQMFWAARRKYSREFDSFRLKVASPLQLMKATNWNPQTQCKRHLASKLSSNILENWTERLRRSSKMEKETNKEEKKNICLITNCLAMKLWRAASKCVIHIITSWSEADELCIFPNHSTWHNLEIYILSSRTFCYFWQTSRPFLVSPQNTRWIHC